MKVTPLSREQAAVVSAYTGFLIGNFSDMQDYAAELFGRPIYTHEFGFGEVARELQEKSRLDFLALNPVEAIKNLPKEAKA